MLQICRRALLPLFISVLLCVGALNELLSANSEPVCASQKLCIIRNIRKINKGQEVLESNLKLSFVANSNFSSRPIQKMDYLIERVAGKQFPAGHIFTYKDFGLPETDWPTGNDVIVYALRDIKKGCIIRTSDVSQGKWTRPSYLQGGFSDLNLVINRPSKFGIQKGQILILPDVGLGMDYAIRMAQQKPRKKKP